LPQNATLIEKHFVKTKPSLVCYWRREDITQVSVALLAPYWPISLEDINMCILSMRNGGGWGIGGSNQPLSAV
jgi:hypothetical protein